MVQVNDGLKASFWHDHWQQGGPLCSRFSYLYKATAVKSVPVAECVQSNWNGDPQSMWAIPLRRRISDREMNEFNDLLHSVPIPIFNQEEDKVTWRNNGRNEQFLVKNCIEQMQERERINQPEDYYRFNIPYKNIWIKTVPPRVQFFAWTVSIGRILTTKKMQSLGFRLASRCPMCIQDEESDLHLLFNCVYARNVWNSLRSSFNSSVWDTTSVLNAFISWKAEGLTSVGKVVWRLLLHAGIWEAWKERNRRIFEDKERSVMNTVDRIKNTIWRWSVGFKEMKLIYLDCFLANWEPIVNVRS